MKGGEKRREVEIVRERERERKNVGRERVVDSSIVR
jgi:hypothetical protein